MPQNNQRLSTPFDPAAGERLLDIVIVGSGYGGSIMAARLAAQHPAGSVSVLERGRELQPGQYPETFDEALTQVRSRHKPQGMFDLRFGRDMDVLVGNALGGGSIINAAVMVSPNADIFEDERWPQDINGESMLPYINNCVLNLGAARHPQASNDADQREVVCINPQYESELPPVEKMHNLQQLSADWGIEVNFSHMSVAINHQSFAGDTNAHGVRQRPCDHCGNCVTGCNVGAKNTLLTNYLPRAVQHGAKLYSGIEVVEINPSPKQDYRYQLSARVYPVTGDGGDPQDVQIHCRTLFLAAGALGSTEILLRAQQQGALSLSPHLGRQFSANGDAYALVSGMPSSGVAGAGRNPGPCINSMLDFRQQNHKGFILQDGGIPSALADTVVSYLKARGYRASGENSQVLLAIGHDDADGQLMLDANGRVQIVWVDANAQSGLRAADDAFRQIARHWGGDALPNPRAVLSLLGWRGATPISAHPLGGCAMGDSVDCGVTDDCGRVWSADTGCAHPGLYVVDGALVPTSLAVNPSLTIAALAERAAEMLLASELAPQNEIEENDIGLPLARAASS